jgi:putative N6-adenine-specific DNA methylase
MTSQTAIERRIKQHITSQPHTFFTVVGPGLEPLCRSELKTLLPGIDIPEPREGGLTFTARLHDAYAVNLGSATASRVLMRIGRFTADGFGRFKRKIRSFPWELFISETLPLHVTATLHKSRLYHRDAVAERVREAIEDRFSDLGRSPSSAIHTEARNTLYVRAVNNRFTLSLDMSGEHLHKRGVKTRGGEAPLRETLAAGILTLSGYDPDYPLLDPMCGTGTFSIEAAMIAKGIPPGWFRDFAFTRWPNFQPGRWQHLKREAEKGFRTIAAPLIFASDRRAAMVGAVKESIRNSAIADAVTVKRRDFFDMRPDRLTPRKGLVVLNPPYGKRLDTPRDSRQLYQEIGRKLRSDFKGWRFGILMPPGDPGTRLDLEGRQHALFHGGLGLTLTVGHIR